jgi:hypothetical protein
MVSFTKLLIGVATVASVHVSATTYCQCENRKFSRIFPGIEKVCSGLDNNWCSTNCNAFRKNCNYCQFTPRGTGPDAPYQKLKSWCFQQSGYSSSKQMSYRGSEVNCYSYRNKANCWHCRGCSYANNGDLKMLAARQSDPAQNTDLVAPSATVTVVVQSESFSADEQCTPIFQLAAVELANDFASKYSGCTVAGEDSDNVSVNCVPTVDTQDAVQGLVNDFKIMCSEIAGGNTFDSVSTDPGVAPRDMSVRSVDDVKLNFYEY